MIERATREETFMTSFNSKLSLGLTLLAFFAATPAIAQSGAEGGNPTTAPAPKAKKSKWQKIKGGVKAAPGKAWDFTKKAPGRLKKGAKWTGRQIKKTPGRLKNGAKWSGRQIKKTPGRLKSAAKWTGRKLKKAPGKIKGFFSGIGHGFKKKKKTGEATPTGTSTVIIPGSREAQNLVSNAPLKPRD
jgi:hypothetical protein